MAAYGFTPVRARRRMQALLAAGGGGTPAVPLLASTDRVAILGCSVDSEMRNSSMWQAFRERLRFRPNLAPMHQVAHFGDTSTDWLDRLTMTLALKPACLILGEEVNSINKGLTDTVMNANVDTVIAAASVAGVKLLILAGTRAGDTYTLAVSPTKYGYWTNHESYRASLHQTFSGSMYIVYSNPGADRGDLWEDVATWRTKDGVHDSNNGAMFFSGKAHAANLASYFAPTRRLPTRGVAVSGLVSANPFFTGTSGSKASTSGGAVPTGIVPSNYTVRNVGMPTVNCACSIEDNGDGTFNLVLAITGTATPSGSIRVQPANISVIRGRKYRSWVEYEVTDTAGTGRPSDIDAIGLTGSGNAPPGLTGNGTNSWGSAGPLNPTPTEGHVPMPRKVGMQAYNYGLSAYDDLDTVEPWAEGYPGASPVSVSFGDYFTISPATGTTVDIKLRLRCYQIEQIADDAYAAPYYQGGEFTRPQDSQVYRINDYMRVYSGDGSTSAGNKVPQSGRVLVFGYGDWSGGGLTYDIALEVQDGGIGAWTTLVADLGAASWSWTCDSRASGTKIRMRGTATNSFGTSPEFIEVIGTYA